MDSLLSYASVHRAALMSVSVASALMFVGSLLLVPMLIARAPVDFFTRPAPRHRGVGRLLLKIARNVLGGALLIVGVAMLVLPGQGLLMVLLALSLVDLPKKRVLVRTIVQRPPVWRALSYFRERAGKPPFERP